MKLNFISVTATLLVLTAAPITAAPTPNAAAVPEAFHVRHIRTVNGTGPWHNGTAPPTAPPPPPTNSSNATHHYYGRGLIKDRNSHFEQPKAWYNFFKRAPTAQPKPVKLWW